MHLVPDLYLIGYADLRGLLDKRYQDHDYAIVLGKRLDDDIIDAIQEGPTDAYYHLYNETNEELAKVLSKLDKKIQTVGISTIAIPPTLTNDQLDQDFEKELRYYFSHKMAATRAGLGWIGKTDLFVSKKFGPRLRLATLLINHPLKPESPPIERSRCGECRRCVDACPAGAANGKTWDTTIDRDLFFNAHKCRSKCRELSLKRLGRDESICGICISVCPLGQTK